MLPPLQWLVCFHDKRQLSLRVVTDHGRIADAGDVPRDLLPGRRAEGEVGHKNVKDDLCGMVESVDTQRKMRARLTHLELGELEATVSPTG